MANNLTDGLNELAQGFQKRFKVTGKLTIQDMIDLVTPPPSIYLLDPGTYKFSTDWGGTAYTDQKGSVMSNVCYIATSYMNGENKGLVYGTNNQQLTLRLHIWFTAANNGDRFRWGLNGFDQKTVTINDSTNETISDYSVAPNSKLSNGNMLSFAAAKSLTVNVNRSYVEIIK
ncbi:hypothetical protein AALA17_03850 [Lactobacillaceae bacterium 24-114]